MASWAAIAPITMPKFRPIPAITGMIKDNTIKELRAILVNSSDTTKVSGCLEKNVAKTHKITNRITTIL